MLATGSLRHHWLELDLGVLLPVVSNVIDDLKTRKESLTLMVSYWFTESAGEGRQHRRHGEGCPRS